MERVGLAMDIVISETSVAMLALMKIKGVGRRAALRIVDTIVEDENSRERVYERAARQKIAQVELREAWSRAEEQMDLSRSKGIGALALHDDEYPDRLRNIPDPPAVLFYKGDRASLTTPNALAVVGTREPTSYGETVAKRLAATAAREGFVVVSGLAHGCDTFAHQGCLEASGVGVVVLAHGLEKVYPAANKDLAKRLLEHGGCAVSEYPVGMAPVRTAFAERDRIQSGLSDGVLVIETDVKGGTMHTVRFCREQKRPLACIQHPNDLLHEAKTQGNQMLIMDGHAEPIPNGDALLSFLSKLRVRTSDAPVPPHGNGSPQFSMDV